MKNVSDSTHKCVQLFHRLDGKECGFNFLQEIVRGHAFDTAIFTWAGNGTITNSNARQMEMFYVPAGLLSPQIHVARNLQHQLHGYNRVHLLLV